MSSDRAARVAGCLAAALAVACGPGEAPEVVAPPPAVVVEPVRVVDLEDRIEATGELQAPEHAEIAAEVAGRISEIAVREGNRVEADTVVLEIDREGRELDLQSARAGLAEARASLAEQEREVARIRQLHERQVASESRLDTAKTQLALARSRVDAARAALGVAERALRKASVRAPFSGFVARRLVSRGEFVQAGQPLFELVALDPIEVELHLPEVDSGRVVVGQAVAVRVAPHPDEVFHGRLSYVSPTIDPRSRTLRVKAELANADGRLRPGLFARADLGLSHRPGVALVPEEAILQRADGAVVFRLVGDDRVERLVIGTGVFHQGAVEATRGLADGVLVVTRGHAELLDGERVLVRDGLDAAPVDPAAISSAPRPETRP